MQLSFSDFDTPAGAVRLVFRESALVALHFRERVGPLEETLARRFGSVTMTAANGATENARELFASYLAGDLDALDAIEVDPGGTPFQQRVWARLREIPVGRTIAYGELARSLGDPKATRAVAAANGRNPVAIVIPCHRVIAKDGQLWGYAGGLDKKRWLLTHEGALAGSLGI